MGDDKGTAAQRAWAVFSAVTDILARHSFPDRRYEVRGTLTGFLLGLPGFLFGSVGIARGGGAIPLAIGVVTTALFALIGNRWGIERDLQALKRDRQLEGR